MRESEGRSGAAGQARRFCLDTPPSGGHATLTGPAAHRLTRVLRLPVGASVELFDGSGAVWPARIEQISAASVRLSLGAPRSQPALPDAILLAALIRPTRYEWLLEKATELGATAIVPLLCERSAVRPAEIGAARLARWRRITIEAAEQCGRATLPALSPPISLAAALTGFRGELLIAAEPAHGEAPPVGALPLSNSEPITILVGPEGGLTPAEFTAAVAAGGQPVSLGPLVLRAETAALAALALITAIRRRDVQNSR